MRNALRRIGAATALCMSCGLAMSAPVQAPAALVEEVHGTVPGIEFMDYVAVGREIRLGPKDSIVLGYLRSCWRETITGGTVTVGDEQSKVQSGKVERSKVECDSKRKPLGAREATQSAATVYRSLRKPHEGARLPELTLYGRSPLLEVNAARGQLVIERLDQIGQRFEVAVTGKGLVQGRFLDLDKVQVVLTPGASYAATLGTLEVDFRIDAAATPGATPLLGRLLRFDD